jgi:hypothetical protein
VVHGMDILAEIPLWMILIGVILLVFIFWKLIKFAIKVFIALVVFFIILIGLDLLGVFSWINENILSQFL